MSLRIPPEEKTILLRAAALKRTDPTDFVRQHSLKAAREIIEEAERLELSERDSLECASSPGVRLPFFVVPFLPVAIEISDTSLGTVRPVLRSRLWSASEGVNERHVVQGFRPRVQAKAIELLPVDTDDVSQIAIPTEHRPEDVVEFGQPELVRDSHDPDHHRIHVAQHGP